MKKQILLAIANQAGQPVSEDQSLESLKLDSLEFLDLILAVQEVTGILIEDAIVSKLNSVGDLVAAAQGEFSA